MKIKWNWNFSVHKVSLATATLTYLHLVCGYFYTTCWKSWVVVTKTIWPTEQKIFTVWPFIGEEPASDLQSIRDVATYLSGGEPQSLQPGVCPPPWGFFPNTNHCSSGYPEITNKQMDFAPGTTLPGGSELGQNSTCINPTPSLEMIFFPIA